MNNTKICDTPQLMRLCREADVHEFNRRVNVDNLEEVVDSDGLHVISILLPFHNLDQLVESGGTQHHRCELLVKVRGTMTPLRIVLDIADQDFRMLPDPPG